MHPHEIVVREVQCNRSLEVGELLGKSIGQPCETPHLHPHGQVLAFDVGSANPLRLAHDLSGERAHEITWAVAFALAFVTSIDFHELREVYVCPERFFDRLDIGREPIGRKGDAVCHAVLKIEVASLFWTEF